MTSSWRLSIDVIFTRYFEMLQCCVPIIHMSIYKIELHWHLRICMVLHLYVMPFLNQILWHISMFALLHFYISNGFNSFMFPSQYKQHRNNLVVHSTHIEIIANCRKLQSYLFTFKIVYLVFITKTNEKNTCTWRSTLCKSNNKNIFQLWY